MIELPSGRSPEKAPRWDLMGIEGCGGGKMVLWLSSIDLGYKSIYRRKKSVRGAMRVPRGWGARPGGQARLPASWLPRSFPDVYSKSPGLLLFQERSSRRLRSVWIPFDIPFLRNTEIGKKTATGTGPLLNWLVPQK